jgi:murein DD-endopeptidase MepM/ murein hydrolase activator NlpD
MDQEKHFDGLTITAIGVILLMGFGLLRDAGLFGAGAKKVLSASSAAPTQAIAAMAEPGSAAVKAQSGTGGEKAKAARAAAAQPINSDAIAAPYDHFIVTQGIHGAEYGHMAIDISAGKGATIKSPINGTVTKLYIDDWGNPSLTIENDHYAVELLHGQFSVKIGDIVTIGQPIGKESNQGETFDGLGRSCAGRDCGYHTHINVFDKKLGTNVNPFQVLNIK